MYVDSHCHLTHDNIAGAGAPAELVARAVAADVRGVQTICCRISDEFPEILKAIEPLTNVWCSVGTHPHDASDPAEKAVSLEEIIRLSEHPKVIGIGESGLDYYYTHSTPEDQATGFRKHIRAAIETGLPLIIHARDADVDVMRILKEETDNGRFPLKAVLHCFSSGGAMAMEALELGCYVSFSGMITFKKSDDLRAIASRVPLDRLLIETDAPFLAPVPYRGKDNEPAYVPYVAAELAKIHEKNAEDIGEITTSNFFTLFDKALKTWVEMPK